MAQPLRDLRPQGDVKGGSPRTPIPPLTVSEYQQSLLAPNGHGIWRALACGLAGLNVGLVVAWFTAIQNKGVTSRDLEDYVDKHSPYLADKALLAEHNRTQDESLGILRGKQERVIDRLGVLETIQKDSDRDLSDCKKEMKLVADYMEEQRKFKK